MKKGIKLALTAVITFVLAFSIYYYWPKSISTTIPGVLYQLSGGNVEYEVKTSIVIDGSFNRNLLKESSFVGKIEIVDDSIYNVSDTIKLFSVSIDNKTMSGLLMYHDYYQFKHHAFGTIYINKDFTEVAIAKLIDSEHGGKEWNGKDGYMFAAPANSREEAIIISKKLVGLDGVSW